MRLGEVGEVGDRTFPGVTVVDGQRRRLKNQLGIHDLGEQLAQHLEIIEILLLSVRRRCRQDQLCERVDLLAEDRHVRQVREPIEGGAPVSEPDRTQALRGTLVE